MNKGDMINILVEATEYTEKELKKLNKSGVQEIYDIYLNMNDDDDFSKPLLNEDEMRIANQLTEFHGVDGVQEILDLKKSFKEEEDYFEEEEEDYVEEEEEEIVIDISKLSPVEQRAYRRTGQLPPITYNRYTRFDDENPKMEN